MTGLEGRAMGLRVWWTGIRLGKLTWLMTFDWTDGKECFDKVFVIRVTRAGGGRGFGFPLLGCCLDRAKPKCFVTSGLEIGSEGVTLCWLLDLVPAERESADATLIVRSGDRWWTMFFWTQGCNIGSELGLGFGRVHSSISFAFKRSSRTDAVRQHRKSPRARFVRPTVEKKN